MIIKLLSVVFFHLLISVPTYARADKAKSLNYLPSTASLMKGEVHLALRLASVKKVRSSDPDLLNLDSLGFSRKKGGKILIAKTAFVVDKPAGFFDHLTTGDERYLTHTMGNPRLEKVKENEYKVTTRSLSFRMKTYFDSDDISTLPNSKVTRAVTQARKLDVISQSASSTVLKEFVDHNHSYTGGIQVKNFIPIKENKTLILTYTVLGVKPGGLTKGALADQLRREAHSQQSLINLYQVK